MGELTSIWKKFGGRSSLIFSDLYSESEPGNTDSLESSIRPQDHPAQTRPASLATRESKVSSSTEFASAEVAVNEKSRTHKSIAEERVGLKCSNLRVLNSYWVGQ